MKKTAAQGKRDLDQIVDALDDTQALATAYAEAVLREAVNNAHGRPTPQAPMVGDAMGVQGSHITVLTGGTPAAVSGGSEWGSDLFPQFGPRHSGGWWLMPAAESESAKQAGDAYLEQIMDDAIGSF